MRFGFTPPTFRSVSFPPSLAPAVLAMLLLAGSAQAAQGGAAQRTIAGLSLSGSGLLLIPITLAYDRSTGDDAGKVFPGSSSVILLSAGVQLVGRW